LDTVTIDDLPEQVVKASLASHYMLNAADGVHTLKDALREPERQIILETLRSCDWNRKKAASVLDINRTTLYNKMKEYDLLGCKDAVRESMVVA
jgi:two-component system response regulator HydG